MRQLPSDCQPYKKTPVFTESTIPAGLLQAHQTKAGTWGKIVILEGQLIYRILQPEAQVHQLSASLAGVVEPQILHEVEAPGPVKFFVEFYR